MRSIIIITPHYHPETAAVAKRLSAMAKHLADRGWRVQVITLLPNYPRGRINDDYNSGTSMRSVENQVVITRLRPWIVPRSNLFLRVASELFFAVRALALLLRQPCDLIVATTPDMFLGPMGLLASRLKRVRFVWDVRDLIWRYIAVTRTNTYGLDRMVEKLMLFTACAADGLITTTASQLAFFGKCLKRSMVLPNGVSQELLKQFGSNCTELMFKSKPFKVMYVGLLGYPQGLSTLIEAAQVLPEIEMTLVGDGLERAKLEKLIRDYSLRNVHLTGYVTTEQVLKYYHNADILVTQLRNNSVFGTAVPSKLWEYMATGRPVIFCGKGEAAEIMLQHGIGVVVPPEDPMALAEAIRALCDRPGEAVELGKHGRQFVTDERNREKLLEEFERWLASLVS